MTAVLKPRKRGSDRRALGSPGWEWGVWVGSGISIGGTDNPRGWDEPRTCVERGRRAYGSLRCNHGGLS